MALPSGTVDTGFRAEDSLTALARLQQAYKEGIVGYQDLMGLIAKPAETVARIDQAKDASSAARENMRVRPAQSQDTLDEIGARAQLRPKVTAVKGAEADAALRDRQFGEKIRPMKEGLATSELEEGQFEAGVKKETRGDRATAAKATAQAGAVKAVGEAELAPGDVANSKTKQQVDAATLERELKDPDKRRRTLIEALTKAGVDFDPTNDSDEVLTAKYREASKAAKQSELDMERAKAGIKSGPDSIASLRKEVAASEPIKQLRTVDSSYRAIEAALQQAPNGVADLTSVYSFIKVLDPDSVVKEGEIKLSQAASPALEQFATRVQGLVTGQRIPEATAKQMRDMARILRDEKAAMAANSLEPVMQQVDQMGLPASQVFNPSELALIQQARKQAAAAAGPQGTPGATPEAAPAPAPTEIPPGVRRVTLKNGQVVLLDAQNRVVGPAQ